MKNDPLDEPVEWNDSTYEYCRSIVRKAIAQKYSGLQENPNAWIYYSKNINKCPSGYGTGDVLIKPRINMP